jgi:hypothetical protein
MADKKDIILKSMEIEWSDHFHMRDQTWKTLQYSIFFFLGVVGLEIKDIEKTFLRPAYIAVMITSFLGFWVALHHRRRQKEKFAMIKIFEEELELRELIQPILDQSKKGLLGWVNTSTFIVVTQLGLFLLSLKLYLRL